MNIKTLLLTSAIACSSIIVLAQDPLRYDGTKPIEYDFFGSNKMPLTIYIKKGTGINFKISNFNKSLYTISVNNTDKSLYTEDRPPFKVLKDIDVSKLSTALTGDSTENALPNDVNFSNSVSSELAKSREAYHDTLHVMGGTVHDYMLGYNKLKRANQVYKDLERILSDDCRPFNDLKRDKLELTYKFLTEHLAYQGNKDESSMSISLQTESADLTLKLENLYTEIIKRYNAQKNFRPLLEKIITKEIEKLKTQGKNGEAALSEVNTYQGVVKSMNEILDETISEVRIAKTMVDPYVQQNFPANLKRLFDRINESNFVYISPVFKANADIMTIKFKVEAKTTTLACSDHRERLNGTEIEGKVTGFKMNFSSGLFGVMGKNIFDQSYKLEAIEGDTVSNTITKNNNKSRIAPAVGAVLHFYYKRPSLLSWGGAFGLSVNNKTNLNYHGGISVLFGEEQRIILSAGATLANVELLSDEYTEGGKISKSITTLPTDKFYRWGTFISLTCNLAKL